MNELDESAAWYPHFKDALHGLHELRGRMHRGKIVASNHGYYAIQNTCRLALGYDVSPKTIGDPVVTPPHLENDQIADYALVRGLEVFDRIQQRTEFLGIMVTGGMLRAGQVIMSPVIIQE